MTPVLPEELSALLDGELDPRRAAEVERQIASDPELGAAFDALRQADGLWRSQAGAARFAPRIDLPPSPTHAHARLAMGVGVAAMLVALRVVVRGVDAVEVAFGLQAVVMVAVLIATAALTFTKVEPLNARQ